MRVDVTSWREPEVRKWKSAKPYTQISTKALILLERLANANGYEMQRTDLFRACGYEANRISAGGNGWTDFTDFRLFTSGLVDMRATGCQDRNTKWGGYTGVTTYWTINKKGLAVLAASYLRRIK